MLQIKELIFAEIRKTHEESAQLDDTQLNNLSFHHPDGLRLTLTGFRIIKNIFTAYSFEIPETLKSRHRRGMSKMTYPYFFTTRRLVLFSDTDAMVIKLSGGIEAFLETCSQIDRED